MFNPKIFLVSIFSLALTIVGCGNDTLENKTQVNETKAVNTNVQENIVKIAYLPITHSLAAIEAFEESVQNKSLNLKIELVRFGSWPELLDALNTGRVDGAIVLVELAMKAREQGIPIKAVALGHRDGNVVIGDNELENFSGVKGKTIAIPHRQSSHHILVQEALKKNNMSIADIKITELAPTEMPSALASNQVEGYCVAEPFGAMAVNLNLGKVLYSSEELWPDSICCGLVLTEKFINSHKELAHKFVEHYKASGAKLSDHDKALVLAQKYFKQQPKVLEQSLKWIKFDNLELTKESYDTLVSKVKEYGLSDNPPAYEDFVKNDL